MGEVTKPGKVIRVNPAIISDHPDPRVESANPPHVLGALGYKAQRAMRVRILNVHLGELRPGQWRHLTATELAGLLPPGP